MHTKSFYIYTIGCQMNVYDSERMALALVPLGYVPAFSADDADLVVVNTCSVRAKAEQKAFSVLGRLAAVKRRRPEMIIAVAGCVAQQEGERIRERARHVDLIVGTRAVERLASLVRDVESHRRPIADLAMDDRRDELPALASAADSARVSRFVTVMRGCDNFCAYCVVPYVRGRETSRTPQTILHEIRTLVASGVREVTLLGQNVNSYGAKEGLCSFPELLEQVNEVEGLVRIRFTTSHPKDLTAELIQAFARIEKLCPHIHLPVQSGSNRILERMNRSYTREHYLDNIAKLRDSYSGIAITSDMIVGFPGETNADFEATLDLLRRVEFDGVFAFMYSERPNVPARQLPEKVPKPEARARLQTLLALQENFTYAKHRALVGTVQEVLVEGFSKRRAASAGAVDSRNQWSGRTPGNKIVHFFCDAHLSGEGAMRPGLLARVRIERALSHSLWGSLERHLAPTGLS